MADTVLIVDDEPAIRESLAFMLERDGFAAVHAGKLAEARERVAAADLVVLDLKLPDGSGLDFLRELRRSSNVPVIVLTSRDGETDRVVGLELGADDYVTKPFSPREVVARVRAVLRRRAREVEPAAEGRRTGLWAEAETRRAGIGERPLELSKTEFELLSALLGAPGRVFERGQLLERVWTDAVVGDRTVDVHVKALRRKIEEAGGDPELIETVRGVGYRLKEPGG